MGKVIDIIGQKFGRLIVIRRVHPNNKYRTTRWLCKCECGNEKIILKSSLKAGKTKSCGCLSREHIRKIGKLKLGYGIANMKKIIRCYQRHAKRRGLEWNLTEEQFKEITQQDCYYCGAKPSNSVNGRGNNGEYIYNGIDRVDNTKGYTMDNIVPCCKICNLAKGQLTLQEFKDWAKRLYSTMLKGEKE